MKLIIQYRLGYTSFASKPVWLDTWSLHRSGYYMIPKLLHFYMMLVELPYIGPILVTWARHTSWTRRMKNRLEGGQ